MVELSRRGFLAAGGVLAAGGALAVDGRESAVAAVKSAGGPLIVSAPMLQNPAPTSVGVAFAVSALANGFVDYALTPDLAGARRVKCGGYRVTGMNDRVMQVRLTGLKEATTYYYRIGADRIHYGHGYDMKVLGTEIAPEIRSFTTSGAAAKSAFAVINDTHASKGAVERVMAKVAQLAPPVFVWNGDVAGTLETIEAQIGVFLAPVAGPKDYAASRGCLFVPGNHDQRGLANRQLERVVMFRQPEERASRDWDLGRNFAFRQGDVALIGLDTGEDKHDGRDVFAGLFCNEPYREAQARWLADVVKRPDIASAPYIVAFCHIPLYDPRPWANPGDIAPNDTDPRYRHDFALWQRTCAKLWGPILNAARVQLVVAAHEHGYRHDAPGEGRDWTQIVGGGPELTERPGEVPTVIEGRVEAGRLRVTVHDVYHGTVLGEFDFKPRS